MRGRSILTLGVVALSRCSGVRSASALVRRHNVRTAFTTRIIGGHDQERDDYAKFSSAGTKGFAGPKCQRTALTHFEFSLWPPTFTPTHLRAEIGRSYSKSLTPRPNTSAPKLRDVGTRKSVTYAIQYP